MDKAQLLRNLDRVEYRANASKLARLLHHPVRYLTAIAHRKLLYPNTRRSLEVATTPFFGTSMHLLLPAGTDIYLTGGKSHASEIKLARFLIHTLNPGDVFVDVGAHFGYFSLLAGQLVGETGRVVAFEASPPTFAILEKNCRDQNNILPVLKAVSDTDEPVTFYVFPTLYSEYNTLEAGQFRDAAWFRKFSPEEVTIEAVPLTDFLAAWELQPAVIKIDVEGAEDKAIRGLATYLQHHNPVVVMEYLSAERGNHAHRAAETLLANEGYAIHAIGPDGHPAPIDSVENYLLTQRLDSDNIVFARKNGPTG